MMMWWRNVPLTPEQRAYRRRENMKAVVIIGVVVIVLGASGASGAGGALAVAIFGASCGSCPCTSQTRWAKPSIETGLPGGSCWAGSA